MAVAPEACYRHVSPQLLARVRQLWSARGLDLDAAWGGAIRDAPGFLPLALERRPQDSRPVDLLLLFDQAAIWVYGLRVATGCAWRLAAAGQQTALSGDQLRGLLAILGRLRDEIAAVRVLAVTGLPTPAMQIMRSISEDVDMALVVSAAAQGGAAVRRVPHAAGGGRVLEAPRRRWAGVSRRGRAALPGRARLLGGQQLRALAQGGAGAAGCGRPHLLYRRRRGLDSRRERLPLLRDAAAAGAVRLLPDAWPGAARRPRRPGRPRRIQPSGR